MADRSGAGWEREANAGEAGTATSRYRILLAEDDPELRTFLATALWLDGYDLVLARDGSDLLDRLGDALLRAPLDCPFDLIISDDQMPGWTGLQMLAGLRNALGHPPVVLMTAFGSPHFHAQARGLGAAATLDKPFELDLFRAVVQTILAPRLADQDVMADWPY
jgi:two-component system response regulator (stage 0 sporulation protein F)